jgi:D-galacturonate reductase
MRTKALDTLIIGGGMITHDLILPSVYHLRRIGVSGAVTVCSLSSGPLRTLAQSTELREAFPQQSFRALPRMDSDSDALFPDLYREALSELPRRQAVIVAVPDWLHYPVIMEALRHDQHVLSVKPLVLEYAQEAEIEKLAYERGLFVGVEYHKRFDRRALLAKRLYGEQRFGEFAMGEAKLHEPYYYRHSNFQNWFTREKTDPFTYVGCHHVDLVSFITGLKPVSVSLDGIEGAFPNGNVGYLWSSARVRYENGAMLTVTNGLGYPDDAAGANDQGLIMYCEGPDRVGMINHNDQERGVRYSFLERSGAARYRYVSPDFFRLVPWEGTGLKPVGYGFDSIAANLETMQRIESEVDGLDGRASLERRRIIIREVDNAGIIATPANSWWNELVVEAARTSIANGGMRVEIEYGDNPHIKKP